MLSIYLYNQHAVDVLTPGSLNTSVMHFTVIFSGLHVNLEVQIIKIHFQIIACFKKYYATPCIIQDPITSIFSQQYSLLFYHILFLSFMNSKIHYFCFIQYSMFQQKILNSNIYHMQYFSFLCYITQGSPKEKKQYIKRCIKRE